MTEDSLDVYLRSLVVEAIGLESPEIRITRIDGPKVKVEMEQDGTLIDYPHPPKTDYGDVLRRLRERTGTTGKNGGEAEGRCEITRHGGDKVTVEVAFSGEGAGEQARLRIGGG